MDPISMIFGFVYKVLGFVKSGVDWRHAVNAYETNKTYSVAQKYQFSIFPLDFVSIPRSAFSYDRTPPGSAGDYSQTVIKVKDIYPFILNAHSSAVYVRSFRKSDPSAFDHVLLNTTGWIKGTDGRYWMIDDNHAGLDKPGTPGILTFYINNDPIGNRRAHTIRETGKAYALAPNVRPNIITDAQVLVKGENWIYGLLFLMIIAGIYLEKQKNK